MKNWNELTALTHGDEIIVEEVRVQKSGIKIKGEFELPSLAQLDAKEQVFVSAFIQVHGSIKEMEKLFGISYPTVKNRLNKISEKLNFVINDPPSSRSNILDQLESGTISVDESLEKLKR